MLYAILCYDSEAVVGSWSKEEDDAVMGRISAVTKKLAAQNKLGPTLRLMPTTAATTLRQGREPLVIDGPFAETKEQLLGFYILNCENLDEAIEAAKELAATKQHGTGSYEIRPVFYFDGAGAEKMGAAAHAHPALQRSSHQVIRQDRMLYAILCYHDEAVVGSWSKEQDDAELAKRSVVQQKLAAKGKLGPVARLMPTSTAANIRPGREPVVMDGPFAETKEQLLGFYVIDCASLDEATAVARDMIGEDGAFEIRPLRVFRPGALAT